MLRLSRRTVVLGGGATAVASQGVALAQTPRASTDNGVLVAADPVAGAIHFYDLGSLRLIETLHGFSPNAHAGFLAMPDGRLLFVDAESNDLVVLQVLGEAGPRETGRVAVPENVSHFAVDPALGHVVVGASDPEKTLTLVDLDAMSAESFKVAEAGEAGVAIGDGPLTIFHRNDATMRFEAYPVASLKGSPIVPASEVETGAAGHGEGISHDLGRVYTATDDGFDVVDFSGGDLTYHATLPWDVSGRTGGRAYFARMGHDEGHLFSYVAIREADEAEWPTWTNDLYVADLNADEATRYPLANGLIYRFGLSDTLAIFARVHPDGDAALLVDVIPGSATFGEVVAEIPLDDLTNKPIAGASPWEAEGRIAEMSPDSQFGFVTHGGDGLISVIDIDAAKVAQQLKTPTALETGGYLIVMQDGAPFVDTIAR